MFTTEDKNTCTLFQTLVESLAHLFKAITCSGIRETDPRLQESMRNLSILPVVHGSHGNEVDRETFKK